MNRIMIVLVALALGMFLNGAVGRCADEPPPVVTIGDGVSKDQVKSIIKEVLEENRIEELDVKKKEQEKKANEGDVIGDDTAFRAYWKNALFLETADKAFKVHVGGRIHADFGFWNTVDQVETGIGGVGLLQDGANFRRARIRVNGTMYEHVEWIMEYGFDTGVPAFFDVFAQMTDLPYVGTFRVGHFREPFSMDALTGGNDLAFIERSLIQDAFVPFRNTGILITDTALEEQISWALGLFRSNSNLVGADAGDRNYAITGRVTYNLGYDPTTGSAIHFGIAGSHRNLPRLNAAGMPTSAGVPSVRLATRPEFRVNAPAFVDTGVFNANQEQLLGLEFAVGYGPFLFQSEYVAAFLQDVPQVGTGFFQGFYAQASYFLTGETRPYNRAVGIFGEAIPYENFFWVRNKDCKGCRPLGLGAWEIGTRYSYIDLTDGAVNGGRLHDVTFGLNWHINPNARWMLNYILSWRELPGGTSDGLTRIIGMRAQLDF